MRRAPHGRFTLCFAAVRLWALLSCCLALACQDRSATEAYLPPPPPPDPALEAARAERVLYDAEGKLLPSDQVVAGLTLPRGLTLRSETSRRWMYISSVPLEKLQAYFGPRLITGQVREGGGAVTFVAAVPRDARGGVVKLDVRIGPNPSRPAQSFVDLRELPPPPVRAPSEAEIRMQVEREFKYAD